MLKNSCRTTVLSPIPLTGGNNVLLECSPTTAKLGDTAQKSNQASPLVANSEHERMVRSENSGLLDNQASCHHNRSRSCSLRSFLVNLYNKHKR